MKVEQVYNIVNSAVGEVTGNTELVANDLSNIVAVGDTVFNSANVDNYVKKLVNKVGRTIFVDRPYSGNVPSLLMDSWEYGSVLEKIRAELPTATENKSWELENGTDYTDNKFYQPDVSAKFYNSKTTFEVPMSFTERQLKESFHSATEMNAFLSMLYNMVDKAITLDIDSLIMRTIDSMIVDTYVSGGVKSVNLLKAYNTRYGTSLTKAKCLEDKDFIRYATYMIGKYKDRISTMSELFNIGGKKTFTSEADTHIIMLSDFRRASDVFLQSDTFHNELVSLPTGLDTVPFWQGSGKSYDFTDTGKIIAKTATNKDADNTVDGVLAVMFDKNALGVCNTDRRVTTNYVPQAEFYTNYYKADCSYFTDANENFILFYVADEQTATAGAKKATTIK